ncbi:MAG: hypothetical protein GWP75_00985, partial [Planctomycetia bacterium]|nr:hypothetical protein [Planctomycetia bacterium]
KYDPEATWFDTLEPLTDADAPFFPGNWPDAADETPGTVPLTVSSAS